MSGYRRGLHLEIRYLHQLIRWVMFASFGRRHHLFHTTNPLTTITPTVGSARGKLSVKISTTTSPKP